MTGPPPSASPHDERPSTEYPRDREGRGSRRRQYGKTAKVGALWSILRQGGDELIAIPTTMIMARLLSPADFGAVAIVAFFIRLAGRLTQFGFNAALVRIKDLRPEHASSVFVVSLAMGVAKCAALTAAAPAVGRFFDSPAAAQLMPLAALSFLINPFGTVPGALMQRRMQFRYGTWADWSDTLVSSVVTVCLALLGHGVWSIVYGQLAGMAVRVAVQLTLSEWVPRLQWSAIAIRELFSFGLGLQSKRLLEHAALNLDNLVVGRILGVAALGFYDKAFTTMNRVATRLVLGQAPFRIFSIIHEDGERFRRAYSRLVLSITLIGFPVLAGCIIMAEPLFVLLYGERWLPAVPAFQLLCAGGALKLLNAYGAQANEAVGSVWPQVRRQALGTVCVVIGAWAGSVYMGVTGAALGVLAAMVVVTVTMQSLVRRVTGLSWWGMLSPLIPALTCAVLLAGVLMGAGAGLRSLVSSPAYWQFLLVQGAAGTLFYALFVLWSPFPVVRSLVTETLDDILPSLRLDSLKWRPRPISSTEP
jgi:teichuronic acid exporter